MEDVENKIIPVGCVLTMVGTGSEMNGGSVITNHEQKLKIGHVFGESVFPKFSISNPRLTFTVPQKQMVLDSLILCLILWSNIFQAMMIIHQTILQKD